MILSNKEIYDRLFYDVIIHPFNMANLNTASYDVTLGANYYVESVVDGECTPRIYNPYSKSDVDAVWKYCKATTAKYSFENIGRHERVILLPPRANILAHTQEFIGARRNITTMMKARSSIGRNLIAVCMCAGMGDVGYFNRWTMEITNKSDLYTIPLVVGRRIAQIVFLETGELFDSKRDYAAQGKYQTELELKALEAAWTPEMMLPKLYKDREICNEHLSRLQKG